VRVVGLHLASVHTATAHNLTVDDIHTYYVVAGTTPVLVHNSDEFSCGTPLPTQKKGPTQKLTNAQATDLAKYLGYRPTGRIVNGERVFTNGKWYTSRTILPISVALGRLPGLRRR